MVHCRYCGHRAGRLRRSHRQCAETYRLGLAQMVDLVVAASGQPDFTQRRMLRTLDGLAQHCYVPTEYLHAVLAAGWHLSDINQMVDDVLTQSETARLREFRDGHNRRRGPEPGPPLLPAPVLRGSPSAGPGLAIRGTGPIGGGQRTPAFPWT